MRTGLVLAAALCVACGPSAAQYTVVTDGSGEPAITHINRTIGSRYTFGVMNTDGTVLRLNDAAYVGKVTLTQGPEVLVYGTPAGDVYLEVTPDGLLEFTWGDDTDVVESPILSLKLPLRLGSHWRTMDSKGTPFYEYQVEALERVTVPAGTFDTAKVVQLNLRDGNQVNRWYAQDVGLVQRDQSLLFSYSLAQETP